MRLLDVIVLRVELQPPLALAGSNLLLKLKSKDGIVSKQPKL